MLRISLFITIFAFLLFRPYALEGDILYPDDDWSYFAHASSIAFGQFPFYKHEYWMVGNGLPAHPIGPGMLAAPFVAFFSIFDRWGGSDIITQRTPQNIPQSWALFGFVFATGVYFWCGCAFLFYGLKEYFSRNIASWSVILLVIFEGVPLFAFRRPIYSHIYSFFVLSVLVFLLMFFIKRKREMQLRHIVAVGLTSGLTILIRFNDVFLGVAWPLIFAYFGMPGAAIRKRISVLINMYAIIGALVLFFYILPSCVNRHESIFLGERLLQSHGLTIYFKRILHIFFGVDWGLVFTAPFLLIALGGLAWIRTDMIKPLRYLAIFLCINFWVVIQWMTQGGWYGYRYFIFTAFPLLIYPFAFILDYIVGRWGKRVITPLAIVSLFPVLSMISFEGMTPNLSLHNYGQYFGVSGWGNNFYQLEIWRLIIQWPSEFLVAIFKGGPCYVLYLILHIFHKTDLLPLEVELPYLLTTPDVYIKTLLIYITPFCLWIITVLGAKCYLFNASENHGPRKGVLDGDNFEIFAD